MSGFGSPNEIIVYIKDTPRITSPDDPSTKYQRWRDVNNRVVNNPSFLDKLRAEFLNYKELIHPSTNDVYRYKEVENKIVEFFNTGWKSY